MLDETSVFRPRHSASNAHTYRLSVFKERALRRLKKMPKQQSAKTTILARFAETCQPVGLAAPQCEGRRSPARTFRIEPASLHRRGAGGKGRDLRRAFCRDDLALVLGVVGADHAIDQRSPSAGIGREDALLDRHDLRWVHREA